MSLEKTIFSILDNGHIGHGLLPTATVYFLTIFAVNYQK